MNEKLIKKIILMHIHKCSSGQRKKKDAHKKILLSVLIFQLYSKIFLFKTYICNMRILNLYDPMHCKNLSTEKHC